MDLSSNRLSTSTHLLANLHDLAKERGEHGPYFLASNGRPSNLKALSIIIEDVLKMIDDDDDDDEGGDDFYRQEL